MAYIYVIECEDNSLYTGIAKDIRARMALHIKGTASKCTRSKKIKCLRALWSCPSYSDAARLEYAFKRLTKKEKLEIVENPQLVNGYFEKLCDICFEVEALFDIWCRESPTANVGRESPTANVVGRGTPRGECRRQP